jgi:SRSO17 transposase
MEAEGVSEARFAAYVEQLARVLGHADRREPLHDYCLGLLLPIERKSVEPMAAVTAPAQVAAKHQSLLPFPTIIDPEAPPIRPERHVANSIASVRRRLIVALARSLPRCPCCNAPVRKIAKIPDY